MRCAHRSFIVQPFRKHVRTPSYYCHVCDRRLLKDPLYLRYLCVDPRATSRFALPFDGMERMVRRSRCT